MQTRLVLAATLAALLSVSAAQSDGLAQGRAKPVAPLQGTWQVVISPYVCSTGQPVPNASFRSRVMFNGGGTMIETTSNRAFEPGQRSPGLGTWERTGRDTYRAVFEAYVLFTSLTTNPPRYQRGEQRIDQLIEMDGPDSWNSSAAVSFRDEAGTPVSSGCMTARGTRLPF
jgi:hypothetical protein